MRLPDEVEVFRALADPQRRLLLDRLNGRDGQTLRELCAGVDLTRQAVSKHLAVLESAGLITTIRRGREKFHHLNAAPITEIADRWIRPYHRARAQALADLKRALEESPMDRPSFVHTSYVRTTPERLFAALTEPAFTWRYWQSAIETDWTPGAPMTWRMSGAAVAHPEQVVLEFDPPRRLAYTWHTFTPEWAAAVGVDEDVRARLAAERRSRVSFELEPDGPVVKLTVVHDDLEPDGLLGTMIGGGWPRVVAELKTLLETGGSDEDGFGAHVTVDAPPERVLAALTTAEGIAGWWTPDVTGSVRAGGEFTVGFGGRRSALHVDHVDPGLVVWTCTASEIFDEWVGTSVWFALRPRAGGGTTVAFRHAGLVAALPCFAQCRSGWEHHLGSLAALVDGDPARPHGAPEAVTAAR